MYIVIIALWLNKCLANPVVYFAYMILIKCGSRLKYQNDENERFLIAILQVLLVKVRQSCNVFFNSINYIVKTYFIIIIGYTL
jgi:hypothetical protein